MTHAQLTTRDGATAVRLSAQLPVPAGRLWAQALTPVGLSEWFPFQVEYSPGVGEQIQFTDDEHSFTGEITAYSDPEELAFTFGDDNHVTITLNTDGDGTTFALVERLSDENQAARNAAGWHSAVSKLERMYEVDSPELAWKTLYVRYAEEGFPVGAPAPGLDDETTIV